VAGKDGAIEYLNRRCWEYTGLPVDDLLGWDWGWIVHPEDLPKTLTIWNESIRTGTPPDIEFRLRRHDGHYRWFVTRGNPLRDADGKIVRWYGTCTDIDDLKKTQAGLRNTEKLFRALVERSEIGFALIGMDRTVRYVSPAGARVMGHQLEDVLGIDGATHVHPEDQAKLFAWFDNHLANPGERQKATIRFLHKDGSYRKLMIWSSNLIPDPDVRAIALLFWEVE
jgi:PAS domain S-box-containing protein